LLRRGLRAEALLRWYLPLGLILALFLVLRAPFSALPYFDDELGYFARHALKVHDSADWGRELLSGYALHPPLLDVLLTGMWKVFGYSLEGTRLLMNTIGAAAIYATAVLGRAAGGGRVGLGAALLLAMTPPFFFHGASLTPEPLVTLLISLALVAALRRWLHTAVGAVMLASLAKPTAVLVLPALVAHWVCIARWGKIPWRRIARIALVMGLLPAGVLAAWLALQALTPGVVVIHTESGRFEDSQIGAALLRLLRPRRVLALLMVRTAQLVFFDFRWVATLSIVAFACLWTLRAHRDKAFAVLKDPRNFVWLTLGAAAALHVVTFTLVGIDALARYLVPALPAFCVLTAAALAALVPRFQRAAIVALAGLFFTSQDADVYRVWRFVMGAWNDHTGYRDMVKAYQEAFAFVDERCARADVAGNYPAEAMAADPRLGYVVVPHRSERLPAERALLRTTRPIYIVAGKQLAPVPQWVSDDSLGRRWQFGQGRSEVVVIEVNGAERCSAAQGKIGAD